MSDLILSLLIGLPLGGIAIGYFGRTILTKTLIKNQEIKVRKIIDDAKTKEKEIILEAKDEALKIKEEGKKELQPTQDNLRELERELRKRESLLEQRSASLDRQRDEFSTKIKEIESLRVDLRAGKEEQETVLQKIAKIKKDEAKRILLDLVEKENKEELVKKIKELRAEAQEEASQKAREIIGLAIQRLASEHTAESTIATVNLPSEEMKGRIIGREGRNIHSFEKEAGVDVIIDDTPEAVIISCFDPIRREEARLALERLVADGRIHPARIEEMLKKAREEISLKIKEAGEAAAYEVGVAGLTPDLLRVLGRLKFRTSYGQNVLRHSIEVANLAGMLASELGADVAIAKKAGLLHDIGKAVDHEVPGSHAIISRDIAKKYGLSEAVLHAIEAHHDDVEQRTVEAVIVDAADAISGSRPGARRETLEAYLRRLEDLENVANSFPGVEKSYAIQAGREVRIIVKPEEIDDLTAEKLSHDIAKKIEQDLKYPGQIKVNVVREVRAIDYAK